MQNGMTAVAKKKHSVFSPNHNRMSGSGLGHPVWGEVSLVKSYHFHKWAWAYEKGGGRGLRKINT